MLVMIVGGFIVRAQGHARLSGAIMIGGFGLNILLDWVLIRPARPRNVGRRVGGGGVTTPRCNSPTSCGSPVGVGTCGCAHRGAAHPGCWAKP